jgi:hypothetical protein
LLRHHTLWLALPAVALAASGYAQPGAPGGALVLENAQVRFGFARPHMGLVAMEDKGTGVDHVQPTRDSQLWTLTFSPPTRRPEDLRTISSTDRPCGVARVERTAAGGRAVFAWSGLDVADEAGVLDVRVTVDLPRDSGVAAWRIWVTNRSRARGLWEVHFPVCSSLLRAGEYEVAAPDVNWGLLHRRLASKIELPYPHGYGMTMQFLCAMRGDSGVYMATHDPGAWFKTFSLEPGGQFAIRTYAENMGVPGSGFAAPFAAMLGVYRGGWLEACKRYRQFAITAPWTACGRLAARRGPSPRLSEVALWMRVGDEGPAESRRLLLAAREYFGVPLGVHWYFWHSNPFDDRLPDYLPGKPGYAEVWRGLTRQGFLIMPYINGRLVSDTVPDFAAYGPYLCRDAAGKPYQQPFGQDMDYPVCPYTAFWQGKLARIVAGITDLGANAVYFDQIAGEPPLLCFDATHGHPVGGGGWWVAGHQEMLRRCRALARRQGHEPHLAGEFAAEPYLGGLDGFLVWTTRLGNSIPMLTAVYSGYASYFGTNTFFNYTDRAWIMREGRDFLWGCQNGWMSPGQLLSPGNAAKAAFLRQVGKYRVVGSEYLNYGELVGLVDHPSRTVTEPWPSHDAGEVTLPAVQGSVWKAADGSLGVFLVNYDARPNTIRFELEPARQGLDSDGRYAVTRIGAEGESQGRRTLVGPKLRLRESLGPREIRFLRVTSASQRQGQGASRAGR